MKAALTRDCEPARPRLGLAFAGEAVTALRDINGAQPNVGRSRLALLLRRVDLAEVAEVVERQP